MKSIMLGVSFMVLVAVLSGCETVKGVGRDIEGASSSMQSSMSRH